MGIWTSRLEGLKSFILYIEIKKDRLPRFENLVLEARRLEIDNLMLKVQKEIIRVLTGCPDLGIWSWRCEGLK